MFLPLENLLPSTLWKEKDNVLTLLPHHFVFGRRVSLPLQQRAANHPNFALVISRTWSSLLPASVSLYSAVGNGSYHQSWQVLFRAALSHNADIGILMPWSQRQPWHFSWQRHCSAAMNNKISLQGKAKRKTRTPHSVVILCCNPPGKHSISLGELQPACLPIWSPQSRRKCEFRIMRTCKNMTNAHSPA